MNKKIMIKLSVALSTLLSFNPLFPGPEVITTFPASFNTPAGVPVVITLTATISNPGNLVTFNIVTGPSNGTLGAISQPVTPSGTQTATVTYTPNVGFTGVDSFTFNGNDGPTFSNTSTITIDVTGSSDDIIARSASINTVATLPQVVALTATTSEGLPLTFSIVSGPSSGSLSAITQPTQSGTTQTALVTYTSRGGFSGADSFTFSATDGTVTSNTAAIFIQVINIGPNPSSFITRLIQKYAVRQAGLPVLS